MQVQPHIVWQLLEIRDRELRERANRAARHAAVRPAQAVEPATARRPAAATAEVAPAGC
jgi:hypothetical protein